MIDEETNVDAGHGALLYDFSKFLTTLSLLALGGVLTLTQTADNHVLKKPVVAMVVSFVALAGVCAFSAASKLAKVGTSRRKQRLTPQHYLLAAIAFLGMGAGGFLMMWWKSL